MKLRLLGTGGADGIPRMHGDDEVSRYARQHRGKEVRSRAAALLDGTIKIDLPPDTIMQLQRDGLSSEDWSALIFTHSDDDHFAVAEIQYALTPFTENEFLPYVIYGNDVVASKIELRYPTWPMEIVRTKSFAPFEHGPYRVSPLKATHTSGEDCQNLIFERDGKSLLYATDTGMWREESWNYLERFRLDALVIECTDGFDSRRYVGHLDLNECVEAVERLRAMKVLTSNSRVVTTHHSSRGRAKHVDLEQALAPHGMEPGFDGMEIEI
jgi:phosphoribosyl 1,2-cyclic phosphate phosphodiesterase